MKTPKRLQPLIDDGLIDEVISRLMSGKEADIFVVRCRDNIRCAKVYKDAMKRSFKKAAQYQEGRKSRSGRQARAMQKRSNYGRQEQEKVWQNAEVDALSRLAHASVRVPETFGCVDGVLLMELITDDSGDIAPRLGDVMMSEEQAIEDFALMIHYIKLMLCEGIVHGDLSEFNAQEMFSRDVNNMRRYYGEFAPALLKTQYAKEIWSLFEEGNLTTHSILSGEFDDDSDSADVSAVLEEINAVIKEEQERKERISASEEDNS